MPSLAAYPASISSVPLAACMPLLPLAAPPPPLPLRRPDRLFLVSPLFVPLSVLPHYNHLPCMLHLYRTCPRTQTDPGQLYLFVRYGGRAFCGGTFTNNLRRLIHATCSPLGLPLSYTCTTKGRAATVCLNCGCELVAVAIRVTGRAPGRRARPSMRHVLGV